MARRILSEQEVEWLRASHAAGMTQPAMAERIGVCVDTLKRLLVRHGIAMFDGAKYQAIGAARPTKHRKPCMRCGCAKPRPTHLRLCDICREAIRQML